MGMFDFGQNFAGLVQGTAGIAQGIDSIWGSGKSHISRDQWQRMGEFAQQQKNFENLTQIRVRDALKAGINPLAALGQSANITPSYSNSDKSEKDFSALGSGIANIAKFFSKSEKEATSLSLESQRLDNEYKRAQIDHLRNMNPGITGGSYTRGVLTSGHGGPLEVAPVEELDPNMSNISQAMQAFVFPDGQVMYMPSSELADAMDVEGPMGINPMLIEYALREYGRRSRKVVNKVMNKVKKYFTYF